MHDEEINNVLHTLMQQQDEMLVLMKAMHSKITIPQEEVWLTKEKVIDYLCISERSFYRRKLNPKWKKRKSGGIWYYLKASLLQQEDD